MNWQQIYFAILIVSLFSGQLNAESQYPNHEQWAEHYDLTESALADYKIAAALVAAEGIFEQVLLFQEQDQRLFESKLLLSDVVEEAILQESVSFALEWLVSLTSIARQKSLEAEPGAFLVVELRSQLLNSDGRSAEASNVVREYLSDVITKYDLKSKQSMKARAKVGVQLSSMGDNEGAIEIMEPLSVDVRQIHGPNSPFYASILYMLGSMQAMAGQTEDARASFANLITNLENYGSALPDYTEHLEYYEKSLREVGYSQEADQIRDQLLADRSEPENQLNVLAFSESDVEGIRLTPLPKFNNKVMGYHVSLPAPWDLWPESNVPFPLADYGARIGEKAGLIVVALPFVAQADKAAAVGALAKALSPKITSKRDAWSDSEFEGFNFSYQQKLNNTEMQFNGRILVGENAAYLVMAFTEESQDVMVLLTQAAVSQVTFDSTLAIPANEDLSEKQRYSQGVLRNNVGLWYQNRGSHSRAVKWFKAAVDVMPDEKNIIINLVNSLLNPQRYEEARRVLDRDLQVIDDSGKLLGYRAFVSGQLGDVEKAIDDYQLAFTSGLENEELFINYIDILLLADKNEEASEIVESRRQDIGFDSPNLLLLEARVAARSGNSDAAEAALESLRATPTNDPKIAVNVALIYQELGDRESLVAYADEMLATTGAGSLDLYYLLIKANTDLGQYEAAKDSAQAALDFAPGDKAAQQWLDYLQDFLGRGETLLVRDEILPVTAIDRFNTADTSMPPPGAKDLGAYYLYWTEAIDYRVGAAYRRTTSFKAKALTRLGLDRLNKMAFVFQPGLERIHVNTLIVRDENGVIINEGKLEDYYVANTSEYDSASSKRILYTTARGLRPGYTVEVKITRELNILDAPFQFFDHWLTRDLPAISSSVIISGDIDGLQYTSDGATPSQSDTELVWHIGPITAFRSEPLNTANVYNYARIRVAGSEESWAELGENYRKELEPLLLLDDEHAVRALELTSKASTDDEKAQILAKFVQGQLTYRAIEFGRRARIPNPANVTLENRYGDCKDHSLLLVHLLRHVGVEAELALVNATQPIETELASLDQFDHMIVYCASCSDGSRYIDTTDKYKLPVAGVPRGLAGRYALILGASKTPMKRIGAYDAVRHFATIDREINLVRNGDAVISETIYLSGSIGDQVRTALLTMDRSQWINNLQNSVFSGVRGLRVEELEADELDVAEGLKLSLRYKVINLLSPVGDQMVGKLPATWENWFLYAAPVDSRNTPFELHFPLQFQTSVTVNLPEMMQFSEAEQQFSGGDKKILTWKSELKTKPGKILQSYSFKRRAGNFAPNEYSKFVEESQQALAGLEQQINAIIID